MSKHCPSHDWDRYDAACEKQANDVFLAELVDSLDDIARRVLPSIVAAKPNLAADDAAEEAFEYAAALSNARLKLLKGSPDEKSWESDFWHRYSDILP